MHSVIIKRSHIYLSGKGNKKESKISKLENSAILEPSQSFLQRLVYTDEFCNNKTVKFVQSGKGCKKKYWNLKIIKLNYILEPSQWFLQRLVNIDEFCNNKTRPHFLFNREKARRNRRTKSQNRKIELHTEIFPNIHAMSCKRRWIQ